jgi:RimJ/RimL family protein N-acetyltransferase
MIRTQRLWLRPWQESDLIFLQSLRNDIDLQTLLLSTVRGSSLSAVRRWLEDKSTGSDQLFFVVELQNTQVPIGYIQLSQDPRGSETFQFGVCLATAYQTQGYGVELLSAIETYLQIHLNVRKLMLQVDESNTRAIACYKKLNYREVGIMHQHIFVHGSLRNVMIMEKCLAVTIMEHCS